MENLSCRDILRHDSPFRQGRVSIFHCFVGLLNTAAMPLALQPEACSVPFSVVMFPPPLWDDLQTVEAQLPSVFVPFFTPSWVSFHRSRSVPGCVNLPAALSPSLDPCGQFPGPSVWAIQRGDPLLIVCFGRGVD